MKICQVKTQKNRDEPPSLFPNLTKSISMKKTLKLFKFYAPKIQRNSVNTFQYKLKNVINIYYLNYGS